MQPRILYPARISFKIEEEIKIFSNKQKLKAYSNTKPRLKERLRGLIETNKKKRKEKKKEKKKKKKKTHNKNKKKT